MIISNKKESFRYYGRQNQATNRRNLSCSTMSTVPAVSRILASDFGDLATRLFLR